MSTADENQAGSEVNAEPVAPPDPAPAPAPAPAAEPAGAEPAGVEPAGAEPAAAEAAESQAESPTAEGQPSAGAESGEGEEEGEAGEGEDSSAGAEAAADGGEGAPAGDKPKRKRRRRRKKKGEASAAGDVSAAGTTAPGSTSPGATSPGSQGTPRKREHSQAPFQKFFEGQFTHGSKRHAFSVGEVVAGRVARVEDGAIAIDLFGKAMAYCDEREPREIPIVQEPPPPVAEAAAEMPLEGAPENASVAEEVAAGAEPPGTGAGTGAGTTEQSESAVSAEEHGVATVDQGADSEVHAAHADEAAPPEEEVPPPPAPNPGDIFRGRVGAVSESGSVAIVNRIIDTAAARAKIEEAQKQHRRVHGLVYGFNRGGFDVLVEGVRAFCPVSGMSLEHIDSPEEHVGKKLEFSVPAAKPGTQGIVVSRRSILEREARKAAKDFVRSLKPGQRLKGRVTQVREFGLFVDIGGVEGLVHLSELSFDRTVKPEDAARVGDEVEVQVLRVHEPQSKKERFDRVSLSMKAVQPDPWDQHDDILVEGSARKGKVMRVAEFGAFVELTPGVEGLLHVSELGKDLKHAGHAIKEGDEVDVVIERVDKKQRRVSLSKLTPQQAAAMAEAEAAGLPKPQAVRQGARVKVKVDRIEHHGVFVQLVGVLGKRGRGYISNMDMGTERGTDHRKQFPPGTELEVSVVGQDRDGGLKLSRKRFLVDEERRAVQDYRREAAKQGFGTFGDLLRQKLGK